MRIQFLNGENAGTWRDIEAEGIGIGRETDNGIQLLAERVSRYHARLERHDDGWFLIRRSLHDPLMPVNLESNSRGGVKRLAAALTKALAGFGLLDRSGLAKLAE